MLYKELVLSRRLIVPIASKFLSSAYPSSSLLLQFFQVFPSSSRLDMGSFRYKQLLFFITVLYFELNIAEKLCDNPYVVRRGDTIGYLTYRHFNRDKNLFLSLNKGKNALRMGEIVCLPEAAKTGCDKYSCNKRVLEAASKKEYQTGLTLNLVYPSSFYNKYSRFTSLGYSFSDGFASWQYGNQIDWRQSDKLQVVKDQGGCPACWAYAATGAVESAYAIVNGVSGLAANLSEQQLIDCLPMKCGGGWSKDALEYIVRNSGISTQSAYPNVGAAEKCKVNKKSVWFDPSFAVSMYEQVNFQGVTGFILALQQQPIIVNIYASQLSFIAYNGGIYEDYDCPTTSLDHTVLLVGYNLASSPPYWIVRNSWGSGWGIDGYMHIAITGGDGLCGITSMPGIYPVMADKNPCGVINPCGGGTCTVDPVTGKNTCQCPTNFISVTNLDNSQSCTPVDVCTSFNSNPCGVGACLNDNLGSYTCICPYQFKMGYYTDNTVTCIPDAVAKTTWTYKVQPNDTCALIASMYGLTLGQLNSQNKKVRCNSLVTGTVLNVTPNKGYKGCSVTYSLSSVDTCDSVLQLFSLQNTTFLSLNPEFNCSSITSGQQVCVAEGPSYGLPICTATKVAYPGDTCQTIMQANNILPLDFFRMNPGINCDKLLAFPSSTLPGTQVCVATVPPGGCTCSTGNYYTVNPGDVCSKVISENYGNRKRFKELNCGMTCKRHTLYVGQVLCR